MKIVTPDEVRRRSQGLDDALQIVLPIIQDVRQRGDAALRDYALRFDRKALDTIAVSQQRLSEACAAIAPEALEAMVLAKANILAYHRAQMPQEWMFELAPGITVGQLIRPLNRVGCYVPGGKYPLVSTVLMTALPALVAGVENCAVCTPHAVPEILAACALAGVQNVYEIGGAQAIAALAYGTESVPKVDKIVGPGNRYVTAAKKAVYGDVGIDFVAGPSEVLIIADETSNPRYIAADLLAQAEHDEAAIAMLVTPSRALIDQVLIEIEQQLVTLPTQAVARQALEKQGIAVLTKDLDEAFAVSNRLAPEHLEVHLADRSLLSKVTSAGAIFWGSYSAEAFGDYAVGPNHVLPTGGFAAAGAGLSVLDFIKTPTFQALSPEGARSLCKAVGILARLEGLEAHARAVEARFL